MKSLLKIFALNFVLLLNGCNTTEPTLPPDNKKPTLTLAIDDTSCTEAWLQLKFNGIDFTNDCSLITQLNGSANKIWGR